MLQSHNQQQDMSKFILKTIKYIKKSTKNIRTINAFCIEFYDIIYYYLMIDKIKIMKKLLRLFEDLAIPMSNIGEEQRSLSLKKISKIKI